MEYAHPSRLTVAIFAIAVIVVLAVYSITVFELYRLKKWPYTTYVQQAPPNSFWPAGQTVTSYSQDELDYKGCLGQCFAALGKDVTQFGGVCVYGTATQNILTADQAGYVCRGKTDTHSSACANWDNTFCKDFFTRHPLPPIHRK